MHGWRRAKCHAVCGGAVVRRSVGRSSGRTAAGGTRSSVRPTIVGFLQLWIQRRPASVLAASDEHPDLIQPVTWSPRHASPRRKVTSSRKRKGSRLTAGRDRDGHAHPNFHGITGVAHAWIKLPFRDRFDRSLLDLLIHGVQDFYFLQRAVG